MPESRGPDDCTHDVLHRVGETNGVYQCIECESTLSVPRDDQFMPPADEDGEVTIHE